MGPAAAIADMTSEFPKVNIELSEEAGVWKVDSCMIWYRLGQVRQVLSGEDYATKDAAIAGITRRVMKAFRESGKTETRRADQLAHRGLRNVGVRGIRRSW